MPSNSNRTWLGKMHPSRPKPIGVLNQMLVGRSQKPSILIPKIFPLYLTLSCKMRLEWVASSEVAPMAETNLPFGMRGKDWVRCGVLAVSTVTLGGVAVTTRLQPVEAICTERCTTQSCNVPGNKGINANLRCKDCSVIQTSCCFDPTFVTTAMGRCTTCAPRISGFSCTYQLSDGTITSDNACCPS